jgi:enoyl-CoA hydratase
MTDGQSNADHSADIQPVLLVDISHRIATITLNRPSARNALNHALRSSLATAMAQVADPAFSAGLDLKELGAGQGPVRASGAPPAPDADLVRGPWPETSKPVIGAINGVAITGGFELALQCDFLVASDRAAFGDTHSRVGVLPGWGLSVLLPQAIGIRRAIEMSMTGNFMGAQEALQFGLVNHLVPHDQLMPTARKLAADIVGNNQPGVRTLLASYRAIHTMTVGDGLAHEARVGRDFARGFRPEAVAANRETIRSRGRTQI